MKEQNNMEAAHETSRLLSELDQAIDHSSAMRDIIRQYERIRSIENITGPSKLTRVMRKEIQILESRLRLAQTRHQKQDPLLSPL
jgi:thioredoxin-like negative regulator of GroEL